MQQIPPSLARLEHSLNHRLWPWAVLPAKFGLTGDLWQVYVNWHTRQPPHAIRRVTPLADALQAELIHLVQTLGPSAPYHYVTVASVRCALIDWNSRLYQFTADFRLN
jgi:hypothetical protein